MAEKMDKSKSNAKNEKKKFKPKRNFRINKKLDGKTGIIFIGHDDPFLYFPDMMSYLSRDEIENIHLKARGKSISNAVNVAEQFKNRFGKEIKTKIDNVDIGTEQVPRKDKKGKIKMSFIDITMSKIEIES
jgi:DNA-binding protein|tara:strand:- start:5534 stop:5926 length:393 start_codon:yes stop_codon:yes gene_type:complete